MKVSFEFFTRDFPGKKIEWKKFLKGFLWKIEAEGKILKGFPCKFTPALVLHVLYCKGDFFYNLMTMGVGDKMKWAAMCKMKV